MPYATARRCERRRSTADKTQLAADQSAAARLTSSRQLDAHSQQLSADQALARRTPRPADSAPLIAAYTSGRQPGPVATLHPHSQNTLAQDACAVTARTRASSATDQALR